jgi:hypothetical protein
MQSPCSPSKVEQLDAVGLDGLERGFAPFEVDGNLVCLGDRSRPKGIELLGD